MPYKSNLPTILQFYQLVAIFWLAGEVRETAGQARITYVTPRRGSISGGTKVTAYGSGFTTDSYTSSNFVFFGTIPCIVQPYTVSAHRLECVTSAHPDAEEGFFSSRLQSSVIANGQLFTSRNSHESFYYDWNHTPQIHTVEPKSSALGSLVEIGGYRMFWEYKYYEQFYVGGAVCEIRNGSDNDHYGIRWRWPLHLIKCLVTEQQAGGWNASVTINNWRGKSWNHSHALYPMHDWSLAMYELYPDIHGVSPQEGSVHGGTLVTIIGTGFSAEDGEVEVDIDGIPCQVITHTSREIQCLTGTPPQGSPAVANESGAYPIVENGYRFRGGRGANFLQYNGINGNRLQYLQSSTLYPDRPQRKGVYPSLSTLSHSKRNNYGERLTAFFNPHASGNHTFFIANDDEGGLWFSSGNNINNVNNNKIISSQYVSGWENYYRSRNQRSDVQDLEVSEDYIIAAEFKDSWGGDYIQVGVLMHETEFTYAETQQVARERQRVELSSNGLYDIQRMSITLNTTQLDLNNPPTFIVEWGGRLSDRFTVEELKEDTDFLSQTVLELFAGVCDYGQEIGVNHYQEVYAFEGGVFDAWSPWGGSEPEVSEDEAFCGRHSLFVKGGRSLAFDLSQPDSNDGYRVSDYPFLCLAYKLAQGNPMTVAVNINGIGWRSIAMTSTGSNAFPEVGSFWDYSDDDLVDNDNWQYSCTDIQDMLMQSLQQSVLNRNEDSVPTYRVTGLGFYTSPGGTGATGFYVDEVSVSSEKRNFAWANYLRPARPNGVALHEIVTTAQISNNSDIVNLVVSMEIVPSACDYNLPLINVTLLDLEDTPGVVDFDFSKIQEASIPISGTFQLVLSGSNTLSVHYGATTQELEQAIEAADDVGDVTVTYSNTPLLHDRLQKFCPGRRFTIQFEDSTGDLPLLEIDTSSLLGDGLTARIVEEVTGGLFLRPIPGHMLQTVEKTPQVHVRIRDQLAACGGGFGLAEEINSEQYRDFCMFKYSPMANPVVDSINPLSAQGGDSIEIRGSGFSEELEEIYIRFGNAECHLTSSMNTTMQCTLSESFAGPKPLYLHVSSRGIASVSGIVLDYSLELDSINPDRGSIAGGTQVTINGRGFYDSTNHSAVNIDVVFQRQFVLSRDIAPNTEDCHGQWQNVVTVGDSVCEIIQSTATTLTVLTPAEMNNVSTYDVTVTILCPEGPQASSSQTLSGSYTYSTVLTPILTSIQPTEGYLHGGQSITLFGNGFSSVAEDNTVKIGGSLCIISSSSTTQITCTTPAHFIGEADVQVSVDGKGRASEMATFTYQLDINSISHCEGSLFGGQTLAIDGRGFGQNVTQIEVRLGDHRCNIIRHTDTNMVCITTSTAAEHYINNDAFHEEYGLGYAWNPSSLTIKTGDTVHWSWTGSSFVTRRGVAEVFSPGDTEYNGVGFRSRQSITGTFSHTFTTPGTYYYITEGYAHIGFNGSITVIDKENVAAELTVMVNSVLVNTSAFNITCGDINSPFQSYTYSVASTPDIQSVTPTATVGDRISLVISGLSDMAEDNTFLFGGQDLATCISSNFSSRTAPLSTLSTIMRTYLSTSEIECTVSNKSPGIYRAVLHVAGRGWSYASLENSVIHIQPRIESISVSSGSLRGGSFLILQMTGVVPSDIAKTRVFIGSTPCPVQSISNGGQLECITQSAIDDGYSSILSRDSPLAYWSLQADYYRSNGSYLESDGEVWFRSVGTLGVRANASIFGTIMTRQRGISANAVTDQSTAFHSSYIQTPVLPEFSEATGFAMDLWIKVPQMNGHYQIVVDSSSFDNGIASGFLLMLNPCAQLEFWIATRASLQDNTTNSSLDCELISDTTSCSQVCGGHLYVPESESLPSGVWNIIRAEYANLSSWQYVHFGWAAGDDTCLSLEQCSGRQVFYINNDLLEETTTYLPSVNIPVSIGGSGNSLLALDSNQALVPLYLDEVAFYHQPLHSKQVHARVHYGASDSQPIWVTVNGVDGVGQGNVPDVAYQEVDRGFMNDTVINWETVQELYVHTEESTAIRFEWTGLHGILQTSRSAFEDCDLSSPYIKQWFQTMKGGTMTFTPELGAVYYFIDSVSGGCQNGRKIRIEVGDVEVIDWRIGQYSDLTISESTGLLFQWDDSVPHNLFEMSTAISSLEDCQFVGDSANKLGKVRQKWQDKPITNGEISIRGLSVGEHHFVCAVNGHCQAGMRFTVTVTPSGINHENNEQDVISHTIPWLVQDYEDLTIIEGDRIIFAWQGFHSLHQVTEDSHRVCDVDADSLYVWGEPSVDNSAIIDGLIPGSYYFICSIAGHCDAGMKIKVTVLHNDGLPVVNNGVPANCAENIDCSFAYSTDTTPQLLQIQPTEAVVGTVVTIRGRGFIPQGTATGTSINSVTVLMDKVPCENVVAHSSTLAVDEIQCTVADYESGYYFVDVFVAGKGYASVNPTELVPGDIRNTTFSANFNSIYPTFFLSATANTIYPSSGSLLGGTSVVISGSGFSYLPSHLDVQIGSAPCRIVSSSFSRIQCITTPASTFPSTAAVVRIRVNGFPASSSLQFEQSSQSTPTLTQLDRHSVIGGDQIVITGTKFGSNVTTVQVQVIESLSAFDMLSTANSCLISSITDTIINCIVPTKAAGIYNVHVFIQGLGFAETVGGNSVSYSLSIYSFSPMSGGNGGGITLTVDGAGFPDISSGTDLSSVVVTLCNDQVECSVTESSSFRLMCTLSVNLQSEQNCSVTVNYNGMTETSSDLFRFAMLLTPEITGLSPTVGGTAGGTEVSLTGTGFFPINVTEAANLEEGDILITIDGAICEWYGNNYQLTETSIACRTSEHRTTLQATVRLFVREKGFATQSEDTMVFEYVDRWSSHFTWGGSALPLEGESVYIKLGQTVYLDINPPVLNLVLIEGTLVFEDNQDLHLQAKYIFINGGKLQIGTESNPFQHRAVITLHGHITDPEIPIYGAKVLGIRQGQLDLHGIPRRTWTRLASTASANATSLHLQESVDWVHGDRIVIAPTSKDGNETEENEVSSVSPDRRTVNLINPLKFTHHGVTETLEDGQFIELRAEVGLLSHNVIVEGSRLESPNGLGADQYGAQIFIHRRGPDPTPIRIEHTEVRYSGQAFRLGRYSIHFHLSGTMNGSYVRNCAIHHSNNRAITAHGVHDLLIEGNVAYDIKGHTYFVEDGVETNNRYIRNLGVLTRGSSSLLNTDQIPATFWITNPQNTFIGNAAAASRAYGFWYDLDNHPSGASLTYSVCPNKETFGTFVNNTAHTCNEFGLRIWETYQPFADGCRARVHQTATLYNFTSYANGIHGVELSIVGHVRLVGFKVADNVKNGIEIIETQGHWGGPKIQDTLIISHTSINTDEPQQGGIKTPNTPRLTISNVTFANFDFHSTVCLKACSHCKVRQGGFQVWFERLNFIGGSQNNKAAFQWEFEVLYKDLDGTLTGLDGGGWVLPNSDLTPPDFCTTSVPEFSLNSTIINGTVCRSSINFLRMAWNRAEPLATLNGVDVIVENEFGRALVPWRHYRLTHLDGYMFTMPDNHIYNITWLLPGAHRVDTTSYNAGVYGVKPSSDLWITHQFVMLPDHIEVGNNYEGTEHGDVPLDSDNNLSWNINNETNVVTYLISGGNLTSEDNDITYEYSYEPCPRDGCPPPGIDFGPYEAIQRRWSDPNSWPSGELPREREEVTISSRWRMLVDISPPPLSRVIVLGELMFEDERDYNFTANLILINGPMARMIIGTENSPFTHNVVITLTGQREDVPLVLVNSVIVGSKAIGVFGNLSIHGIRRSHSWTRLASSAQAGDASITVQGSQYPNWRAGDKIVIAPSGWNPEEAEIRTITAISGGHVILNQSLRYDHEVYSFMEPSDLQLADPLQTSGTSHWWSDGGQMAPEVGLLSHNIVIQGGEDRNQLLEEHHYGCRLLVGRYTTQGYTFHGHLKLDSVELRFCGQGGYFSPRDPRYAIAFRNNFNSSEGSYIQRCSIHHGYNTAIGVHTSYGVEINSNVIWRTTDSSIKVGRKWNNIVNNLAMMTTTIQPNSPPDNHAVDFPATFDIDGENVVRGNAAAGSTRIAFRYGGEPCLEGNEAPIHEDAMFWNNTAHTGLIGLNVLGLPYDCTAIGGFTASHQWNYAIFSSTASPLSATHLKIAVGKVGLNLNVFGPNPVAHLLGKKSIIIRDSLLVGSLPGEGCLTLAPNFRVRGGVSFSLRDHKMGVMMSSFNAKRSKMDGTGAWHLMKGYPVIDGVTKVERVSFARFFDEGCVYNSYAIANNPLSPDAVHPMHMTMTTKFNVNLSSLVFYYEPDVEWIVQEDCVDMDCDGPKHSLVKDLDGRFVGTFPVEGSVVPFAELRFANYSHRIPITWLASVREGEVASYNEVLEHMGIARGEPNNLESPTGGCEWKESWHAYRCKSLQHHMLIIESMDEDTETRRLSPLALTGGDTGHGDYTDLNNGPMDHGWCVYYTCLKRLSTFFTIVAVGTDYCIWMTGSPPSTLRFILLNAGDEDVVKLCIWFKGTNRKDVYKNGIFIEPENVRYLEEGGVQQLDGDYIPDRSSISGANYFERGSQVMHFIVKGSVPVEIRTPPVIQVSLSLAVSIDNFFSVGDLIKNLAFVLKIDPNKIRVVKIISEDTPVRVRRSLLAISGFNQTSITLEFGNLPAPNITTPEPPTVSEEISLAREVNDSVDLEVTRMTLAQDNQIPDAPLEGSNPLNEDPPDTINDFVENLNISIFDYNDKVIAYEEILREVESTNTIGEQVINLILTNELENITNATVVSLSVVPALPPAPPSPPVLPPRYENTTDDEGDPVIIETIQIATPPPLAVDISDGVSDDGDVSIDFVIPTEMRVTMEPHPQTGHLVHVAVTIFDNKGEPVINLGLLNPWMCKVSLVLTKGQDGSAQLGGVTSVPFVRGVAEFTRLRVNTPAQSLTLQFQTIPSRFEVRTSVLFSVVSPPSNTSREKVGFLMEGNLGTLSNYKHEILNAIERGLSMKLDVDISRIKDLDYTITPQGLQVSFDLLNRQRTDPPDVSSLEESISQLQVLINTGALSFPISDETYTAVSESFEFVTLPPPSQPIDSTLVIIAVCTAVGVFLLSTLMVIVICCCIGGFKQRSSKQQKGKGNKDIPLHKISPMYPKEAPTVAVAKQGGRSLVSIAVGAQGGRSPATVAVGAQGGRSPATVAVGNQGGRSLATVAVGNQGGSPATVAVGNQGGRSPKRRILLVKESEVFANPHGDCWDAAPPPWAIASTRPQVHQRPQHHNHHHHQTPSSSKTPVSLSNLANPMRPFPSQSRVIPAGTRHNPSTNKLASQVQHQTLPAGSYLVRSPRKPSNHERQGWY